MSEVNIVLVLEEKWSGNGCCTVHVLLYDIVSTQLICEVHWVSHLEGDTKQELMAVLFCGFRFIFGQHRGFRIQGILTFCAL